MPLFNLVIQVTDKINTESDFKDSKCPKTGDVIEFLPEGVDLGKAVYRDDHAFWRVLQVDIPKAEAEALKTTEPGDHKIDPLLQFRAFYLDLSLLPLDVREAISRNPKAPIPVALIDIQNAKTQRPKRVSAGAIGDPKDEMGIG